MRKLTTSVSGIYTITCIVTGKVYVGQSINCTRRWAGHRRDLDSGKHRNYPLRRAWKAYGAASFEFEIVAQPLDESPETLGALETLVMANHPDTYNLMEPGEPRLVASAETRAKLSAERKARWADPAYRERLKASHAIRNADSEYRERHRLAMIAFNATAEGKAIRSKVANDTWAKEGARERRGEKTKAHWLDPDHRSKQIASRIRAAARSEVRAKRAKGIKVAWDQLSEEDRAARIAAATAKQRTPEGRALAAERTRLSWERRRAKKASAE